MSKLPQDDKIKMMQGASKKVGMGPTHTPLPRKTATEQLEEMGTIPPMPGTYRRDNNHSQELAGRVERLERICEIQYVILLTMIEQKDLKLILTLATESKSNKRAKEAIQEVVAVLEKNQKNETGNP